MIPYLFHTALLVGGFYAIYKILLEQETFFTLNRWLLIGLMLLAFGLPALQVPAHWSVWKDTPTSISLFSIDNTLINVNEKQIQPSSSSPISRDKQTVVTTETSSSNIKSKSIWTTVTGLELLWIAYWIGVAVFGINLLIQLGSLIHKIIKLPSLKEDQFHIVELANDQPPFSFWNYIFINPTRYDWETYSQILEHEKIHVQQAHSLDMLLAELLVVFQWFNPLAWQYRKAIENNLEFATDAAMLHQGIERTNYQMNLLKVSVPQHPIGMTMNYNQSILKKRIKMMNTKKSSIRSSWKYLTLLPVIGLSMISLNAVKVVAQSEEPIVITSPKTELEESTDRSISINFDEDDLETLIENSLAIAKEAITEAIAENPPNLDLEGQITFTNKKGETTQYILGESGAVDGFWNADINSDYVCVQFKNADLSNRNRWSMTHCFDANEFTSFPNNNGNATFSLSRAVGEAVFEGTKKDGKAYGDFEFNPRESIRDFLQQKGYGNFNDFELFQLFLNNINDEYFDYLAQEGYQSVSKDELMSLAVHGLNLEYLKEQKESIEDLDDKKPSVEELIEFRIHGVDSDYIEEMTELGFRDLDMEELMEGKIHGVSPDYIAEIKSLGYSNLDFRDYIEFSIHGVSQDLVESLADAGFANLSANEIKEASIHGVSSSYIEDLNDAGYQIKNIDKLVEFKIHGVDVDFIEEMIDLGFENLPEDQLIAAAIHNVDIEQVEVLKEAGYDNFDIEDVIELAIHNLTPNYIEDLMDLGYNQERLDDLKAAKIHGVTPNFIEQMEDLGFTNIPLEKVIELKIHGVTPSFIKRAQAKGMKDLSLNDYIKLKIHGIVN